MKPIQLCIVLIGLIVVCSFAESKPRIVHKVSTSKPRISSKAANLLKEGPIRGITLGLHSKDFKYDYELLLKEIRATGAPWVSLTFTFFQDSNTTSSIHIPPIDDPFWQQIEKTITQAKDLGLKVLVFPVVRIKYPKQGEWRGTLIPDSYDAWYASYTSLMTNVAKIAARTKADMVSLGAEFNSLEERTQSWFDVIKVIRHIYNGALTYSANWDSIHHVEFQDELDFLGITGYFSLTEKKNPTVEELVVAWQTIKVLFKRWQTSKNIPLIFSELGYTSQDGINMHPWNYTIPDVLDLQEQKDCYTAFTKVWENDEDLYGVFFYEWFGKGGAGDFGYTPRGKPALEVAKEWF